MKLYRFSPILSESELMNAIRYIHESCYGLCKTSFNGYLPNSGNMGIFCHYDNEYDYLTTIRKKLTEPSDDPSQKYFKLKTPLTIEAINDIPETTYTHLYIRKPDIYRAQVGDVDFYLDNESYKNTKQSLAEGAKITGARIFPRNDLDMIELFSPDIDALAYVSTDEMSKKVRIKLSEETNL